MEAQTHLQTYLEQGKQALAQGQGREAAIAYAHAAQLEPGNPLVHLGLAEANLALNSYGVVHMACNKTQELAHQGPMYELAQALLDVVDRRYDQALKHVDATVLDDPANAYAHALRAYLLRLTHQDYDASLARARASRLSFGGTFENCFPPVEPVYDGGYNSPPTSFASGTENQQATSQQSQEPREHEQIPTWSRPNPMQRRIIRTRFWMGQNPHFVTYILISLNVLAYLIVALMSHEFVDFSQNPQALLTLGAQFNQLVIQGQYWRILTSIFLHVNLWQLALDSLSLFFVGTATEIFYGKWRYLAIYLLSGIVSGIVSVIFTPGGYSIGAYGAIFGVFGAIGAFYFINRRSLGAFGNAAIGNWVFWLLLNLAFDFSGLSSGIASQLGGLAAGVIMGLLLLPRQTNRFPRS